MKETFIIIGWFFAIFLVLITSLSFMASNVSGFFPFPREAVTAGIIKCEPRYVEISGFDDCESSCFEEFKVSSYKIENEKCFCDINDC